jgi:hypothetical protein
MTAIILRLSALAALLSHVPLLGQSAGSIPNWSSSTWLKAENGLVLNWQRQLATDAASSTIHIYDNVGRSLLNFDILRLVPDAKGVAIYDVSARKNQMVAVGAVYVKGADTMPAGALLLFDFKGNLQLAVALSVWQEILLLELDENLNVWTLLPDAGGLDTTKSFFVAEYDKAGNFKRELVQRSSIPTHAEQIVQNATVGAATASYDSATHTFWFWLPGSTDLISIDTMTGAVACRKTGLPGIKDHAIWLLRMGRESSKSLVATFAVKDNSAAEKPQLAYYMWSPEQNGWLEFSPGDCKDSWLVGVEGNIHTYFRPDNSRSLCTFERP